MEGLKDIVVIARAEAARSFKSARIIVLFLLYAMFSAILLLVATWIASKVSEGIQEQLAAGADPDQAAAFMAKSKTGLLSWFIDEDPAVVESLREIPLVVIVAFQVSLFWLPLYVILMAFDQISGEIGPRSIRFLTVRTRRSAVLLGKFLAQAIVLLTLVLTVDLGIFVVAKLSAGDAFSWGLMVVTLLKFALASTVFALAYLALTFLCSTLFRQWALSLVFNFVILFVFWLIDVIGRAGITREVQPDGMPGPEQVTHWIAHIRYLTPLHYSNGLLHPQLAEFAVSGAAFAGFTLLFMGAAYVVLRARDV